MRSPAIALAAIAIAAVSAPLARAASEPTVTVVLKDHRFAPSVIAVTAGQKVRIRLINRDGASEEFDSRDLDLEEDVTPNGETSFEIGPLKPGRYGFMGEFHAETAEGEVLASPVNR